jgi:hypothetical protein
MSSWRSCAGRTPAIAGTRPYASAFSRVIARALHSLSAPPYSPAPSFASLCACPRRRGRARHGRYHAELPCCHFRPPRAELLATARSASIHYTVRALARPALGRYRATAEPLPCALALGRRCTQPGLLEPSLAVLRAPTDAHEPYAAAAPLHGCRRRPSGLNQRAPASLCSAPGVSEGKDLAM